MIPGDFKGGYINKSVIKYTGMSGHSSTTDSVTVEEPLDIMVRKGLIQCSKTLT